MEPVKKMILTLYMYPDELDLDTLGSDIQGVNQELEKNRLQPFDTVVLSAKLPNGKVCYDSKVAPRTGNIDLLSKFISLCKEAGVSAYANIPCLLDETFEGHMKKRGEEKLDERWVCPTYANYRSGLVEVLKEVTKYQIDGILLGALYYPDYDFCFCDNCKKLMLRERGIDGDLFEKEFFYDPSYPTWIDWRANIITDFLREAVSETRSVKPGIDVIVQTLWSVGYDLRAKVFFGQDYKDWMKNGNLNSAFHIYMDELPFLEEERADICAPLRYLHEYRSFYVYLYIRNSRQWIKELGELSRILKPKGIICIAVSPDTLKHLRFL